MKHCNANMENVSKDNEWRIFKSSEITKKLLVNSHQSAGLQHSMILLSYLYAVGLITANKKETSTHIAQISRIIKSIKTLKIAKSNQVLIKDIYKINAFLFDKNIKDINHVDLILLNENMHFDNRNILSEIISQLKSHDLEFDSRFIKHIKQIPYSKTTYFFKKIKRGKLYRNELVVSKLSPYFNFNFIPNIVKIKNQIISKKGDGDYMNTLGIKKHQLMENNLFSLNYSQVLLFTCLFRPHDLHYGNMMTTKRSNKWIISCIFDNEDSQVGANKLVTKFYNKEKSVSCPISSVILQMKQFNSKISAEFKIYMKHLYFSRNIIYQLAGTNPRYKPAIKRFMKIVDMINDNKVTLNSDILKISSPITHSCFKLIVDICLFNIENGFLSSSGLEISKSVRNKIKSEINLNSFWFLMVYNYGFLSIGRIPGLVDIEFLIDVFIDICNTKGSKNNTNNTIRLKRYILSKKKNNNRNTVHSGNISELGINPYNIELLGIPLNLINNIAIELIEQNHQKNIKHINIMDLNIIINSKSVLLALLARHIANNTWLLKYTNYINSLINEIYQYKQKESIKCI